MKRLVSLLQESEEIGFFTAESEEIVSLLQKVKTFFFHSANLTDSLLQKVKRLFLHCRK